MFRQITVSFSVRYLPFFSSFSVNGTNWEDQSRAPGSLGSRLRLRANGNQKQLILTKWLESHDCPVTHVTDETVLSASVGEFSRGILSFHINETVKRWRCSWEQAILEFFPISSLAPPERNYSFWRNVGIMWRQTCSISTYGKESCVCKIGSIPP